MGALSLLGIAPLVFVLNFLIATALGLDVSMRPREDWDVFDFGIWYWIVRGVCFWLVARYSLMVVGCGRIIPWDRGKYSCDSY